MKKLIAFDLDGTLAESKSPIRKEMSDLLDKLLSIYHVCVISGGKFEQFEKQLLSNLEVKDSKLKNLHIMPTCGTRYFTFDAKNNKWGLNYAEDFSDSEKQIITKALEQSIDELGYREENPWGELIEDRGSQITFSALGQEAPVKEKEEWDPTHVKKHNLRKRVAEKIPEFEVRTGGTTSIDVTKLGIDKAYGMKKLMNTLDISKKEILFIGDRLEKGGNDYPVKAMGIDSIEVSHCFDTALVIKAIISMSC